MMCANDTVIFFSAVQMLEMEVKLNMELNILSEWLSGNKLVPNLKKIEFMVFGTYQRLHYQDMDRTDRTLEGESVKHSNNFKCLGMVLDSTLTFNLHIDYVKKKIPKTFGIFSGI